MLQERKAGAKCKNKLGRQFGCCPRSYGGMDIAKCHSLWHPKSRLVREGYRMEEGHIFTMGQENVPLGRGQTNLKCGQARQRRGRCQMITAANTVPVEALWNGCSPLQMRTSRQNSWRSRQADFSLCLYPGRTSRTRTWSKATQIRLGRERGPSVGNKFWVILFSLHSPWWGYSFHAWEVGNSEEWLLPGQQMKMLQLKRSIVMVS